MKILMTGGGSGGHFYPIIAIAEQIRKLMRERKLLDAEIFYMAPEPFDNNALIENNIVFRPNAAGKVRRYFSFLNFIDVFKTGWGIVKAVFQVFSIYPDIIFGKGGYGSLPALVAGKLFRIPVVIHESDSVPGKVNAWAGKFAEKVAISFPEASDYFPEGKTALTGNPIRKELMTVSKSGAHEFLDIDQNIPTILILGGSMGSQTINDTIIDVLPELVKKFQIIHQTGKNNFKVVKETANLVLQDSQFKNRYKVFDFLNILGMRMAAGAGNLIISRAGSTIFEIANWGIPSILIPITDSNGDHQRKNAFSYERSGACIVIEEKNLAPHVLLSEINKLMENSDLLEKMKAGAKSFAKPNASELIANEIIEIALKHEK